MNGSSKSTIRVKCNQTVSVAQNAGYGDDGTSAVVYALHPYYHSSPAALVNNALYQNYVRLYEETKLIGMKLEIAVTSPIGGADTPSLQLYTSFDRRHGYGELAYTVDDIKKSSSSIVSTALNNNVAKIVRSIYASDLIEKAQWHDSELDGNGDDKAWVTAATNPNFFVPSFFMFLNSPSLGAAHEVKFTVSCTYYVSFRNPAYGAAVNRAAGRAVAPGDLPDDGGDMDDTAPRVPAEAPSRSVMATSVDAADHVLERQRNATRAIQHMQREADIAARRRLNP